MTLLVIAAMSEERRCIEVLLTDPQPISDTRMPAVQGTIGNATVLLSESGIGKVNAALTASEFITRFHADGVISTGVAGGLQPGLHVMDVVAASSIVYHDACCGDENEPGQIQGMPARFAADARFLEAARALPVACRVSTGLQTSGDWFVTSREKRDAILAAFPEALSVDMESGALAQTCHIFGIPFISFRILSDTPGETDNHAAQYADFWTRMAQHSITVTRAFLEKVVRTWTP